MLQQTVRSGVEAASLSLWNQLCRRQQPRMAQLCELIFFAMFVFTVCPVQKKKGYGMKVEN
jgi:hypothetical protein